jgi:hypothetical protein
MKKIILVFTAVMLLAASSAALANTEMGYDSSEIMGKKGTETAVTMGKLSTNVSLYVKFDTTAFAAITKHKSGNRTFGTSSNDTRIYYSTTDVGSTVGTGLSNSDSTDFQTTGWYSL